MSRLDRMLELLADLRDRGAISTDTYDACVREVFSWPYNRDRKAQGSP
jgi:hypothetical protein